ncbi:MAG TPA: polyphosphate polymerase domain-containing protein [Micropruina sp.]|nr:polyphosphate polymerase domain-containing protein [Micropruina sp.]
MSDTTVIQERLAPYTRIGLVELDASAALPHRVDTKYLLPTGQLAEVLDELAVTHAVLDIDGSTGFDYRSAYFDTPVLSCFHAHRQGRRLRWKIRTRTYQNSGRTRLEVKLKDGRGATDKHALVLPGPRASDPTQARDFLHQVLTTRYRVDAPAALITTLVVCHQRMTLTEPSAGARVTIDTGLWFNGRDGQSGLRPGLALVETKSLHGRSRADAALHATHARPVAVSKYCTGMALTSPDLPEQPWRRLLRDYFLAGSHRALVAA